MKSFTVKFEAGTHTHETNTPAKDIFTAIIIASETGLAKGEGFKACLRKVTAWEEASVLFFERTTGVQ